MRMVAMRTNANASERLWLSRNGIIAAKRVLLGTARSSAAMRQKPISFYQERRQAFPFPLPLAVLHPRDISGIPLLLS